MEHSAPPAREVLKSVRQGKCPMCTAVKTGLILAGPHLVWRPHSYKTHGGTTVECRASVVAVCVAPETNPLHPNDIARCLHDR